MHYYQFNIGDYRKDTAHLTPIEHYIYRTLIDWYYLDEKPIPKETQVVIRRLCLDFSLENNLVNVLNDFFVSTEKGWEHKRIKLEINDYHGLVEKNRVNGNKGGRPRKTQSVSSGLPKEPNRNPNQEPITNNQEPLTSNHSKKHMSEYSDDFATFWTSYPKKTGKGDAWITWKKLKPDINQVLSALSWQTKSYQWQSGYIPNPKTYLNGRRWEDSPTVEVAVKKTKHEAHMDFMDQVFGRKNGTNRQTIDVTPQRPVESSRESIPKTLTSVWKPDDE